MVPILAPVSCYFPCCAIAVIGRRQLLKHKGIGHLRRVSIAARKWGGLALFTGQVNSLVLG